MHVKTIASTFPFVYCEFLNSSYPSFTIDRSILPFIQGSVMRNLRNIHCSLIQSPHGQSLTAYSWDIGTDDSAICAFGPTKDSNLLELKRRKKYEETWHAIASWDAPCPLPDLDCDHIVDLHCFSDTQIIVLVLAGGDLVVVREEPQDGEDKIEIVGSVDAGISAASWSPDEELLAITTRACTLLYMTREFDNVVDVTLTADDLKASNAVSVGWGKKETQFKGKKARVLRDPTVPETVDEGVLHPFDTKSTSISWRGDGAYLAVNSIEGDRRIIRVYSREGILDSVSEPVDNLKGSLSWRPVGNIIAGIQRLDVIKVVFFERNGLRHGHFDLRLSLDDMATWGSEIALKWNVDSSVLAVCFKDRVQLWTMGNYHYYLKQEIRCASSSQTHSSKILDLCWHPEKPLHFLLGNEGNIFSLPFDSLFLSFISDVLQRRAFASVVDSGPNSSPHDYGLVAVIDGISLKSTPMRLANVPPPMALHEIQMEDNVIDLTITYQQVESKNTRILIAILHQTTISLFECQAQSIGTTAPAIQWRASLVDSEPASTLMPLRIAFGACGTINVLYASDRGYRLKAFDPSGTPVGDLELTSTSSGQIQGLISQKSEHDLNICLIFDDRYPTKDSDRKMIESHLSISFTSRKATTQVADSVIYNSSIRVNPKFKLNGEVSPSNGLSAHIFKDTDDSIFFYLNEQGSLFANERCLVRNCTSFLMTPAHLIFTTSQHLLKFVHLKAQGESLEVPPDTPESDERCRSIERGAKLVTVMPTIFALVLQMPRGNLETIYPRALVLAGIRDNLNQRRYKKAFLACRNHRVDMNILHDHAPEQFLKDIGLFVEQVKKVEHIDLFLSQLKEEDVSKIMYRETLSTTDTSAEEFAFKQSAAVSSTSKINRICDAFLQILHEKQSEHLQNIISAHACKSPPDLDAGLTKISRLRKSDSNQVEAMVEHICFLADTNRLYDNALGLYDLELTLLIAQQTQKDPREYIPFLQNLQKMSELRRQFSIDDYLGRHSKALTHLCNMDTFEEVKTYAVKHLLYGQALEYYRYQEDKLQELTRLHADILHQEGKFKHAGIAYEYLKDYTNASESFRQAHLWRESLSCATLVPFQAPQLKSLALSLSDMLIETKEFHSSAIVHMDYLSDIPAAARLFCKGYHFADAIRIAGLHQRLDLLESVIDPCLVEGMANMTGLLADCKSQLNAQLPRIRELRLKKVEDPLAFWEGDIPGGRDIPDDVSIAPTDASTTGGSLFTRYTNHTGTVGTNATRRTSKNRRREERKRARGKKGSVYEEEYLVNSIVRLIERVNSVGDEVSRLVVGLTRRGMRERARAVEMAMLEVVELCKECVEEVFQSAKALEPENVPTKMAEYDMLHGSDGVLLESQDASNKPKKPEVKDFERMLLFGT